MPTWTLRFLTSLKRGILLEYLAITLLAAVFFFYQLESVIGWWMDESWFSVPALDFARHARLRMPTWAGAIGTDQIFLNMPPGYLIWLSIFFKLFGFSEFVARSASAVLGVGTVVGLYAIVRHTTHSVVASLAAVAFLLSDPLFYVVAQQVRLEILVAGGAVLSWVFFLAHFPVLAGLAASACFLAHPNGYVFGGMTLLSGWLFVWPERAAVLRSAIGFAIPISLYGLVILFYLDIFYIQLAGHITAGLDKGSGVWEGVIREWSGRYTNYWKYHLSNVFGTFAWLRVGVIAAAIAALPMTAQSNRRWTTVLPVGTMMLFWIIIPSNQTDLYLGFFSPFIALWLGWLTAFMLPLVWPAHLFPQERLATLRVPGVIGVAFVCACTFLSFPPPPVGENPQGRKEMQRLATLVPDGSRVMGHTIFWREFANRDVDYFVLPAITWNASGDSLETIVRRIRPNYFLLPRMWIDPTFPEFKQTERRLGELALCLGEKLGTAVQIPYFDAASLFRIDWSLDQASTWPSVDPSWGPMSSMALDTVSAHTGATAQALEIGLRFTVPQSRWPMVLTWDLPAANLAPGEYAVEVTGSMEYGEVDFNVNDASLSVKFGSQVLASTTTTTLRIPFVVEPSGPLPRKITVWNHGVYTPDGAPAAGVLQSLNIVRYDMQCQLAN